MMRLCFPGFPIARRQSGDRGRAEGFVCFSASANFVGSTVLGAIGVATLTEVKHRRELLFAAMPCLFALHQFTEGFVWLGLNHKLPPIVAHDAGAAFATCGALFFSGFRLLVLLAWLNLVGLLIVMVVRRLEFTSIWCAYAAVVSVVIYFFFRRSSPERPAKYSLEAAV
jgi:hypothetical protein